MLKGLSRTFTIIIPPLLSGKAQDWSDYLSFAFSDLLLLRKYRGEGEQLYLNTALDRLGVGKGKEGGQSKNRDRREKAWEDMLGGRIEESTITRIHNQNLELNSGCLSLDISLLSRK